MEETLQQNLGPVIVGRVVGEQAAGVTLRLLPAHS